MENKKNQEGEIEGEGVAVKKPTKSDDFLNDINQKLEEIFYFPEDIDSPHLEHGVKTEEKDKDKTIIYGEGDGSETIIDVDSENTIMYSTDHKIGELESLKNILEGDNADKTLIDPKMHSEKIKKIDSDLDYLLNFEKILETKKDDYFTYKDKIPEVNETILGERISKPLCDYEKKDMAEKIKKMHHITLIPLSEMIYFIPALGLKKCRNIFSKSKKEIFFQDFVKDIILTHLKDYMWKNEKLKDDINSIGVHKMAEEEKKKELGFSDSNEGEIITDPLKELESFYNNNTMQEYLKKSPEEKKKDIEDKKINKPLEKLSSFVAELVLRTKKMVYDLAPLEKELLSVSKRDLLKRKNGVFSEQQKKNIKNLVVISGAGEKELGIDLLAREYFSALSNYACPKIKHCKDSFVAKYDSWISDIYDAITRTNSLKNMLSPLRKYSNSSDFVDSKRMLRYNLLLKYHDDFLKNFSESVKKCSDSLEKNSELTNKELPKIIQRVEKTKKVLDDLVNNSKPCLEYSKETYDKMANNYGFSGFEKTQKNT